MSQATILIAEDDEEILEFLTIYLENHDFSVVATNNGRQALLQFEQQCPDLVLLDIILPDMNGFELCELLRRKSAVPILFISCKWETEDIVHGLAIGGDDYITKPFVPQELLARIKANLRHLFNERKSLDFGPLHIDLHTYEVTVDGEPVTLSAKELQLLLFLANNPNRVFHVDTLLSNVWGTESERDGRTVMVHISNLRRKLESDPAHPRWIQTVRGFGYMFKAKV